MNGKKIINFFAAFLLPIGFFLVFAIASKGRIANMTMVMSIIQQAVYPTIIALAIYPGANLRGSGGQDGIFNAPRHPDARERA